MNREQALCTGEWRVMLCTLDQRWRAVLRAWRPMFHMFWDMLCRTRPACEQQPEYSSIGALLSCTCGQGMSADVQEVVTNRLGVIELLHWQQSCRGMHESALMRKKRAAAALCIKVPP